MVRTKKIKIPIYAVDRDILIVYGGNSDEADREVSRRTKYPVQRDEDHLVSGCTYRHQNGWPMAIYVHSLKDHPTIAHEALHATYSICNFVGIPLSDSSEEAYTYLLEYIIREIEK